MAKEEKKEENKPETTPETEKPTAVENLTPAQRDAEISFEKEKRGSTLRYTGT